MAWLEAHYDPEALARKADGVDWYVAGDCEAIIMVVVQDFFRAPTISEGAERKLYDELGVDLLVQIYTTMPSTRWPALDVVRDALRPALPVGLSFDVIIARKQTSLPETARPRHDGDIDGGRRRW